MPDKPPQGRDMGPSWRLSTEEEIIRTMIKPASFTSMSPEEKAALTAPYIKNVHAAELKNKQEYDAMMARKYGVNTPVQQTVESGFKTVAQKLNEEKIRRNAATFTRALKMKLRKQGKDPNNETLIQQQLKQLQTSCVLTGKDDEVTANKCVETLMPSQNGARRRNRTKHRRSRHKRTRRLCRM